jgi:hypothetical protein
MNHLHDWRNYIQEKESWPAPHPHLRELLNAMHSRMGATPPDSELATRPAMETVATKPTAQMGWTEYRKHLHGDAQPHAF